MKACIFDLDGVIVSTDEYHFRAWKEIADREGIYFDRKINDRLRGVSRMDSLEIILARSARCYTQAEKATLAEQKNIVYRRLLNDLTPQDLLPFVRETLQLLRDKGVLLAIGSSSKNTPLILQKIGYEGYFDAVSDGNCVTHSKPHPEVFLKAAEMLGITPKECMVVEDASAGIEAAKRGGFSAAGLQGAKVHPLTDYPLDTIADLLPLF